MSIYAIGDIQGCYAALEKLLTEINFHPANDVLWLTGDLVNRGPQSLEVLRLMKSLGSKHKIVLGNHDLHLLAVAYGVKEKHPSDTLDAILSAPDKNELIDWLRHLPLIHHDEEIDFVLVHAGLAPSWPLEDALRLAREVEKLLQGNEPQTFLQSMYGNTPDHWNESLSGMERVRCIVNYLTRMRFCHRDGRLDLSYKGEIQHKPNDLIPWFEVVDRVNASKNIIFGHWAALNGQAGVPRIYPLDTGCVWGNCLTAMRLEDRRRFSVKCVR